MYTIPPVVDSKQFATKKNKVNSSLQAPPIRLLNRYIIMNENMPFSPWSLPYWKKRPTLCFCQWWWSYLVGTVREVEAGDVHTSLNHFGKHFHRPAGRSFKRLDGNLSSLWIHVCGLMQTVRWMNHEGILLQGYPEWNGGILDLLKPFKTFSYIFYAKAGYRWVNHYMSYQSEYRIKNFSLRIYFPLTSHAWYKGKCQNDKLIHYYKWTNYCGQCCGN